MILQSTHLQKSLVHQLNQSLNQNQLQCLNLSQVLSLCQTQGLGPVHLVLILSQSTHLQKSLVHQLNKSLNQNQLQCLNRSQVHSLCQTQGLGPIHLVLILSLVCSLFLNKILKVRERRKNQSSSGQGSDRRSQSGRGLSSEKH